MKIRRLAGEAEIARCATWMCQSDPWFTLKRDYAASVAIFRDPAREQWVAVSEGTLAGFVVLNLAGAFVGYIQSVFVPESHRGLGVGSELMAFAERRIFAEYPNVFICVSSFNPDARRMYENRGYAVIGELKNYIIDGASEILLRKTRGPLLGYQPTHDY